MKVCMIMAMDPDHLIGANGTMPWHLPSEMQYFKRVTMGKPVIMGRKTFESLKRPLKGRSNIVVTSQRDYPAEGIQLAASLEDALAQASAMVGEEEEVMIIGGASLCREAIPRTEKLYLTILDKRYEGDTWLDSYKPSEWREISSDKREVDGVPLTYYVLERAT